MTQSLSKSHQPVLRSQRFRQERESDWLELDDLLERIAGKGVRSLSEEELLRLPGLYRSVLSALSVARAISLDRATINYLEALGARAYFVLYGTTDTFLDRIVHFFRVGWPRAVPLLWKETLISAAVMFGVAVLAFFMTLNEPDWYYAFVPEGMANGRTPASSTSTLQDTLFNTEEGASLSAFATFLFTHNAQVAIFAFALGIAFGLPTLILLAYNGCVLGAFVALFVSRGLGVEVGGWLMIHGVTELFAVVLAGAAGLKVGWAAIQPGQRTRLASIATAGREGGLVLGGVIFMLMIAGLLEGFGRQLINDTWMRYAIGAATAVIWGLYFYLRTERTDD